MADMVLRLTLDDFRNGAKLPPTIADVRADLYRRALEADRVEFAVPGGKWILKDRHGNPGFVPDAAPDTNTSEG